jgi:hypothetical protein
VFSISVEKTKLEAVNYCLREPLWGYKCVNTNTPSFLLDYISLTILNFSFLVFSTPWGITNKLRLKALNSKGLRGFYRSILSHALFVSYQGKDLLRKTVSKITVIILKILCLFVVAQASPSSSLSHFFHE